MLADLLSRNRQLSLQILAVGLIVFLSLYNLPEYPTTWFDEGSHLHVPKTLIRFGVYADYSSEGFRYYGPTVGVGPTVFLPIALFFKIFGIGLLQARFVMALYLLAFFYVFYRLAEHHLGRNYALLALILMAGSQASNVFEYGRQVLGEVPGMFFVIAAFVIWFSDWEQSRYQRLVLVGALLGLAMVTKYQYVIIVVPVIGLSWLANLIYYRFTPQRTFIIPGIVAVGVMALWMGYQIVYLGPSTISENLASFRQFTSGAALVFSPTLMRRAINELVSFKAFAGGLLLFSIYGGFFALQRTKRGQQWGVFFILITVNLGWYVVASISWLRYAFPGLVVLSLVAGQFFKDMFGDLRFDAAILWKDLRSGAHAIRQQAVPFMFLIWLLIISLFPLAQTFASVVNPPFNTPKSMAAFMDANVPLNAIVETWEPEMGFLTDHQYHYPPQLLLNTSVGYIWSEGEAPQVAYDFVQTENPEYVLVGEFSRWVDLYPLDYLQDHYTLVTTVGAYDLYERNK
jgi:4-amino-4-deoxy-L-arabinose transferase-like glycosyltransferase